MKHGMDQFTNEATPVVDMKKADASSRLANWDNEKTEVFLEDDGLSGTAYLIDSRGESFPITAFPFVIGRGNECDLVLTGKGISRKHVEIVFQSGRFVINDLDSLNGMKVNGYKVARVILEEGDNIRMGEATLTFSSTRSLSGSGEGLTAIRSEKDGVNEDSKELFASTGKRISSKKLVMLCLSVVSLAVIAYSGYSFLNTPSRQADVAARTAPASAPAQSAENAVETGSSSTAAPASTEEPPNTPTENSATNTTDTNDTNSAAAQDHLSVGIAPPPSIGGEFPSPANNTPKVSGVVNQAKLDASAAKTTAANRAKTVANKIAVKPVAIDRKVAQPVSKATILEPKLLSMPAATNSLDGLDSKYLSGDAAGALQFLKQSADNPAYSSTTRAAAMQRFQKISSIFEAYNAGKQAHVSGNTQVALEHWESFLKQEKAVFGNKKSVFANAVTSKVVDQYVAVGNEASRTGNHHLAFKSWQKALSFGDSVAARIAIDNVNQKSKQLYRQALRLEYVNTQKAKELWREVVELVPPGNEYYTKSASKLAWYDKWGA